MAPGLVAPVPGPWSLVPVPCSQVPGLGPWSRGPSPWSLVSGPRSKVPGPRSLLPRLCCQVPPDSLLDYPSLPPLAAGEWGGGEDEDQRSPGVLAYLLHLLCLFWKLLCACLPPPELGRGWGCLGSSLLVLGLLIALIGDLASQLGCSLGLRDSVSALVLVALGTSLPGRSPPPGAPREPAALTPLPPVLQTPSPARRRPCSSGTPTPAWPT